jgi:hypothetical protein
VAHIHPNLLTSETSVVAGHGVCASRHFNSNSQLCLLLAVPLLELRTAHYGSSSALHATDGVLLSAPEHEPPDPCTTTLSASQTTRVQTSVCKQSETIGEHSPICRQHPQLSIEEGQDGEGGSCAAHQGGLAPGSGPQHIQGSLPLLISLQEWVNGRGMIGMRQFR